MVKITFTKPHTLNDKEYVKGDTIKVYEPLKEELVDIKKVAKVEKTKSTKNKGK